MLRDNVTDESRVNIELESEDRIETESIPSLSQDVVVKKRHKRWIVAIVIACFAALFCVIGAILLRDRFEDAPFNDETEDSTLSSTESCTESPDGTEDQPKPIDIVIRQAELTCLLTDEDIQDFNTCLHSVEQKAMQGTVTEEDVNTLDDKLMYLGEQLTAAQVLYYCDLENEEASNLYLDYTEKVTQANNDYIEMLRRVYLSDSNAKDLLFADWTEAELTMLIAYSDEVMELNQRNSEIEVAYQELQDSKNMYYDMIPLYLEMVQNNNRIANIYGYDNYYTYAYSVVYNRDYGAEEVKQYREYIGIYLPEILESTLLDLVDRIGKLNTAEKNKLSDFMHGSYSETHLEGYLSSLPEQTGTEMLNMFDGDIIWVDDDNAMQGAFTTDLNSDRLICYFGPEYDSTFTIIHELGHYYAGQFLSFDDISLDLAETQSQGNEWLFMCYLQEIMSADVQQLIEEYQLYNALATTLISTIVDEFEERIYTHPDVANLTDKDLIKIMNEVCEGYGGINFVNSISNVHEYWRLVVVEQPVYYISYGVSAIAAMSLYTEGLEDYASAVDSYIRLCEEATEEQGFLGSIQESGLLSPFDEEIYLDLVESYCN